MTRNEMIKWLAKNTTREQWCEHSNIGLLASMSTCHRSGWVTTSVAFTSESEPRYVVRYTGGGQPQQCIGFNDVFPAEPVAPVKPPYVQPVYIDKAVYVLHSVESDHDYGEYTYHQNTNMFTANEALMLDISAHGAENTYNISLKQVDDLTTDVELEPLFVDGATYRFSDPLNEHDGEYQYDSSLNRFERVNDIGVWFSSNLIGVRITNHGLVRQVSPNPHKPAGLLTDEEPLKPLSPLVQQLGRGLRKPKPEHNKYSREILPGTFVDVYDVLNAFRTESAAVDHAVKKLLAPGQRGHKDRITDLKEARDSINRAIEIAEREV